MPKCCAVHGCNTNQTNKGDIALHRFPKNEEVKQQWIQLCKRADRINTEYAVVCSLHFEESAYDRNLMYELLH